MTATATMSAQSYDFQISIFIKDTDEPIFSQSFTGRNAIRDGSYITTYSTSDHRLWNKDLLVYITDVTQYKTNQPLLRLRIDCMTSPNAPVQSTAFNFVTREFKNTDQRTIKVPMQTVYRLELHFTM